MRPLERRARRARSRRRRPRRADLPCCLAFAGVAGRNQLFEVPGAGTAARIGRGEDVAVIVDRHAATPISGRRAR